MKQNCFEHSENIYNLKSPKIIVPIIVDALNPKSVVDVGCGIGTFLHEFRNSGIQDVLGIDGPWVNRSKLEKYIDPELFLEVDLEKGFNLNKSFDLALCLEVAEHLSESSADTLVNTLVSLSDIILFSAAIPGQGGQNHLNEQWPEYWINKFKKKDYTFHDVLRPIFWNHSELYWWYRQNMFLVVRNSNENKINNFKKYYDSKINCYVHPESFVEKVDEIDRNKNKINKIISGRDSIKLYIKMISRAIIWKIKFRTHKFIKRIQES